MGVDSEARADNAERIEEAIVSEQSNNEAIDGIVETTDMAVLSRENNILTIEADDESQVNEVESSVAVPETHTPTDSSTESVRDVVESGSEEVAELQPILEEMETEREAVSAPVVHVHEEIEELPHNPEAVLPTASNTKVISGDVAPHVEQVIAKEGHITRRQRAKNGWKKTKSFLKSSAKHLILGLALAHPL